MIKYGSYNIYKYIQVYIFLLTKYVIIIIYKDIHNQLNLIHIYIIIINTLICLNALLIY